MPGLTSSMLIATQALLAQESALNTTSNNIANASTPGYTREVPVLEAVAPEVEGGVAYGQGVTLESVQSVRDELLQLRIYSETSQQSGAQAQLNNLQQVQNLFGSTSSGIGSDITNFFNSLNSLSTDPTDLSQRQAVLTAAGNLAGDFQSTSSQLTSIQQNLNLSVAQSVSQINTLTSQIAQLNGQVAAMQQLNQEPGAIEDQRDVLIGQLAQVANISVTQSQQGGVTITTSDGSALVVGGQSFNLQASPDSNGTEQIYAAGSNITSSFTGGQLGGEINVRDQVIPGVLSSLDALASGLAANVNAAQQQGYDLNGDAGQNLFNPVTGPGAAANLTVAISDPSLIAASSDGSAGSNGNIANLLAVQNQTLASGQTPLDAYSNIVFNVGNVTSQAQSASSATQLSLTQLTDQMGAETGVSIDQETMNLISFQHAFQAAARVITTIDELSQTVLSMGSPLIG
jgi:flagellar hook-associated protein 1